MSQSQFRNQKIIFVVGSTASGKSQWALSLAEKYSGSIVNIDSIQFYEGLCIGSAAPTLLEKKRVPHYLYNYVKAPIEMTAGQYLRDFYALLENMQLKFPLFVVGGTGFYIQALEKGMFNIPEVDSNLKLQIEKEINENGCQQGYDELIAFDPASKVHKNDAYRIGRALEIKRAFGKTMSDLQSDFVSSKKDTLKLPFLKIGKQLDKKVLFQHVTDRTQTMLRDGIIDEVKSFVTEGYADWAPLKSVGYFQVLKFIKNEMKVDSLSTEIVQSTMQLIKKQKTWFQRDKAVLWSTEGGRSESEIEQKIDLFMNESKM